VSEEIWKHLDELHGRLEGLGDDADAAELKERVAGYKENPDDDPDFTERLRESAVGFEMAHPELSRFIEGVVDLLTASGI
jgi:hypothetical protein